MEVSSKAKGVAARSGGTRRAFILAAGGAAMGATGMAADAFGRGSSRLAVSRLVTEIPRLAAPLAGVTVAHLTDLHLYDGLHPAGRRAMEWVAGLEPDIVFVTGDLCESERQLAELVPWLRACRGRLATVVTLGNHEHYAGISPTRLRRAAEVAGAAFLYNERLLVRAGGTSLALVGLDDARAGRPDPVAATSGMPEGVPAIWGFHAPGYADRLRDTLLPRPILALSGHTHGGQIRLPMLPAITPWMSGRFVAGWYRDTFAPLYVTRGIGTSGIRARFRCPPEVAVFTLRPA